MPRDRAGDVDYETHGRGYADARRADPRIAARVHAALGAGRSVINVGAGAGSYEPTDRYVAAVEPSATMRAQRPVGLAPAIDAVAEALPFDDDSFDAAMAVITVHQWPHLERGLRELRPVGRVLEDGVERSVEALRRDLADSTWDERHGHLRHRPWFDGALRLVVARPKS